MFRRLSGLKLMGLCCAALLTFTCQVSSADLGLPHLSATQSRGPSVALPDPLRPAISPRAALASETDPHTVASFVLQAIRIGPGGRYAVINDERLRPGDRLGNAVVVRIDVHSVRLLRDDDAQLDIAFEAPGMKVRRSRSNR